MLLMKNEILEFPPYKLNLASRTLQLADHVLDITHKEFALSVFFFRNNGRVLSRDYKLESVWGKCRIKYSHCKYAYQPIAQKTLVSFG